MNAALQPVLGIIDEGLRLYRRNFVRFTLLSSAVFGATAIAVTVAVGVVPPLPIWMALWYRRNAAGRGGLDLGGRIEQMPLARSQ